MITFVILYNKNDFHYLEDCLKSIPEYANTLLVRTEQINDLEKVTSLELLKDSCFLTDIETNGKRKHAILKYNGVFDFSKARNKVNTLVETEWIFTLDADERFSISHSQELYDILSTVDENTWGVYNRSYSYFAALENGGQAVTNLVIQCRIFRNIPSVYYYGSAHEDVSKSIYDANKDIVDSSILVIHEGYKCTPEVYMQKLKRNIIGIGKHLEHEHYFSKLLQETYTYIQLLERSRNGS